MQQNIREIPFLVGLQFLFHFKHNGEINNSLHLARKYARIFVRGHYLFQVANSFPSIENWGIFLKQLFASGSVNNPRDEVTEPEANNCFGIITQVIIKIPKQRNVKFLHVERVCKSFWKERLTHTRGHLHNASRALSSPSRCFQYCQQVLTKISFVLFDIVVKNKSNVV